jgi:hypothetical protein
MYDGLTLALACIAAAFAAWCGGYTLGRFHGYDHGYGIGYLDGVSIKRLREAKRG